MVERAARALCVLEGMEADAPAENETLSIQSWWTMVPVVETVLEATMLPRIPVAEGDRPETHPDLNAWAQYRKSFGEAGARAREPELPKVTGWHVQAAWRTWNGMVKAALDDSARQQQLLAAPSEDGETPDGH